MVRERQNNTLPNYCPNPYINCSKKGHKIVARRDAHAITRNSFEKTFSKYV